MRVLHSASAGYLWRHPWQLALALLGIAVGVAVIVAVDLANSSARNAFSQSMDAVVGKATHQIIGGPNGLDEKLYTQLRVEHGMRNIAPVIEGAASVGDESLQILGVDPFAEREFRAYLATGGDSAVRKLLSTPGAVVLSAETTSALGLTAGDFFEIEINGRRHSAYLAAVLPASDASAGFRNVLLCDISVAQTWLNMGGRLSRIDVRLGDEQAIESLQLILPAGVQLLNAAGRTRAVTALSQAFATNLTAMSLLALLIGVFLIYNSVSFAVLQRRKLIGVLRALGLTRAETVRLILGEALLLGLTGSALGLVGGILLGQELLQLVAQSINDLYFRVSVTNVQLQSVSLLKGVAAGLLATILASAVPAIEAASYAPRLAQSRAVLEVRTGRALPWLALAGLVAAGMTVPLLAYSDQSLVAGLLALFMLILGVALCIPLLVRWLVAVLAPLAQQLSGTIARLAVAGIGAHLSRTGIAVVALAVAVSATIGVSIMVGSFRLAVSDWLDNTLQSDFYVAASRGELSRGTMTRIAALPGIAAVSSSRRVWLESASDSAGAGNRVRLIALQMAPRSYRGTELLNADPEVAWRRFERDGAVLVSESFAFKQGLVSGDSVYLPTALGRRAFQVAAVYRSYDANPAAVLMSRSIYDLFWKDTAIDALGLYLQDGANTADVRAALDAMETTGLQLAIRSNTELRALSLKIFDRTFLITNVLYWLAVIVAVVGILAAMLALQLERAREMATLRALGVTRAQLAGMVTLQSGLLGLLSGIAALPLGLLMAYLLINVINRRAFGWTMDIAIDPAVLWSSLGLAAGAGAIAGLYPAWRAGRAQPAHAMRVD